MTRQADHLRTIVFPGVQDLPNFAGQECGFFANHGLSVDLTFTSGSGEMRQGIADGSYDLAHGAVDNAIDLVHRGQADVVAFVGLDHGFNTLFVQPEIERVEDLRGRDLLVDAPDTAFALMLIEILARAGLGKGDYTLKSVGSTRFRLEGMQADKANAAAMLNLPFAILADRAGLKRLADPIDILGPYQSYCGWARRDWVEANRDVLTRYIAAYLEGLAWTLANREAAIDLVVSRLGTPRDIAAICYDIVTDKQRGFAPYAAINLEGFRNMLSLRGKATGRDDSAKAEMYLDLACYDAARALVT